MSLYFTLCGAVCILISFSLLNKILKINKINRFFAVIFLFLTCVFSVLKPVYLFNIYISLNMFLYFAIFLICLFTIKSFKGYIWFFLSSLIIFAILQIYSSAFNADNNGYIFIFYILSLFVGVLIYSLNRNFKSFLASFIVSILVFEVLNSSIFNTNSMSNVVGQNQNFLFIILSVILFCLFESIKVFVLNIKTSKRIDTINKTN